MKKKFYFVLLSNISHTGLVGLVAFTVNSALAQNQNVSTSAPVVDPSATVEEIYVTGSRIARDEFSGPSPVVSVDAAEIQAGGFVSIQDVLDSMTQNSGGSLTQQSIHGFTPAASGVNLRGAGYGRTLTLIDGRRVPMYPKPAGGTDNFVDTANIPIGAVERVEVLTSGASAIYGSDAMGGVINIILKDSYEGAQLSVRQSDTSGGGRGTQTMTLTAGSAGDKSNSFFFIEHETREKLSTQDRKEFDLDTDLAFGHRLSSYSSYGASIREKNTKRVIKTLSPAQCSQQGMQYWSYANSDIGGVCGFNRASMRLLFPEQDRTSAMVKYNYTLSESMNFSSNFSYTRSNVETMIEAMAVNDYLFKVENDNVIISSDLTDETATFDQATAFNGDFADMADGDYRYYRRMLEFGHRTSQVQTDNAGFNLGLDGTLSNGIEYDVHWQFSRLNVDTVKPNYATASSFFQYLIGKTNDNPNGNSLLKPIAQSDVDATRYTPREEAKTTLRGGGLAFSGEGFELPAGSLKWAAGFEHYETWFSTNADEFSKKVQVLTTGGASGMGSRDWTSAYAEFLIPAVKGVDVTVAMRHDDYSDFGEAFVPQIAVEYRPINNLLLRGLFAETFRAPDMQRVYGNITNGFEQVFDPYGCLQSGGKPGDPQDPSAACSGELYITTQTGPNRDLDAEEGESISVGLVFDYEWQGQWSLSVDYWNITIDQIVNELSVKDVLDNYQDYEHLITRNSIGEAVSVSATAQNLSMRETAGVDFALNYQRDTSLGLLSAKFSSSYLSKWEEQFDENAEATDEIADTSHPEWRSNLRLGWESGNWRASMLIRYIGEMNGYNRGSVLKRGSAESLDGLTIDAQTKVNLSASYTFSDHIKLSMGINNVSNEGPNEDPTDNGWPHYDRGYFDALGREYYAQLEYNF